MRVMDLFVPSKEITKKPSHKVWFDDNFQTSSKKETATLQPDECWVHGQQRKVSTSQV